ncbi:hypothetical protein CXG81DRAFT_29500 [Caulochytrium protostelioides]|uniref:Rab-GAP TBC domain-containing protein n=2 Tax=Caulochytrium protostelioides TaxID=1555241 RepID=A0A4P9XAS9_9FUNG|nr:hypothetical protein CXG81DRAFT_29500 [Caulochytrium protostelioides]|eukprot:RKP02478.1 hypothetical protein CXG81DRAFT_29500 [Caulochytrium protostelioides]
MREGLRQLRRAVLDGGIPAAAPTTPVSGTASNAALSASRATAAGCRSCTLRGQVWKLFLGVWRVSASEYIKLVERGPCAVSPKIANDVFRTLATDVAFRADVNDDLLTRVLNAFGWKMASIPPRRLVNLKFSYVQGMNVLAAPLLYVMPELDAFYTFVQFIQHTCPLYVQPALEGVHCGLKLLDRCLAILDPELHHYLKSKNLPVTLFAFPSVMTFSACTPPLSEVLQLWDLLLAYGVHLNIIAIVAQLHLIRDQILATPQPNRLLRQFPELRATAVTELTLTLLPRIPEDLYDLLVRHPFDPTVFDDILPDDDPALAELPSAVPPGLRPPSPPLAAM